MTITHDVNHDAAQAAIRAAYQQGRHDEADACSQRHLTRIADILDAIDQHASDPEQLRSSILRAMGHDAP